MFRTTAVGHFQGQQGPVVFAWSELSRCVTCLRRRNVLVLVEYPSVPILEAPRRATMMQETDLWQMWRFPIEQIELILQLWVFLADAHASSESKFKFEEKMHSGRWFPFQFPRQKRSSWTSMEDCPKCICYIYVHTWIRSFILTVTFFQPPLVCPTPDVS